MSAADKLLHRAVHQGDRLQCQALLLEAGADPNSQNEAGETPLHIACEMGSRYAVAELLLGFGANPNIQRKPYTGGLTPLHVAARKAQYREAQLLIDKGGNSNLADAKGRLPLHYAAQAGDMNMARLLILGGNSVYNVTDSLGFTPKDLAEVGNFTQLAKWLANPTELEEGDRPPLETNESQVLIANRTTIGLAARLK